jgi:hypothetical protein
LDISRDSRKEKGGKMNLYLLKQDLVNGYDTYDMCVVAALDETDARTINPCEFCTHVKDNKWMGTYYKTTQEYILNSYDWCDFKDIDKIKVTFLGVAEIGIERGVICSSFNAA